jgi:hypothetical protein
MKATVAVTTIVLMALVGCGGQTGAGVGDAPSIEPAALRSEGPSVPMPTVAPDDHDGHAGGRHRAGTEDWRMTHPAHARQIEAFTTATSGPAGTRVGLKVSTRAGGFRVWAYRIGAYDGGWGHQVWRSDFLPGRLQPDAVLSPVATRTVVAPWSRSLAVDTDGWEPGYYVFRLRTGRGFETMAPYVVSSDSARGTVALVSPVTTWQAYNRWGGYSLYDGDDGNAHSYAVSFDRPYVLAPGANDFRRAALPIVVRAEELGIPLSYFTNVDLHADPGLLDGARGDVSMGHDEYWTTVMRRAVTAARDTGTNLAFLGATRCTGGFASPTGRPGPTAP